MDNACLNAYQLQMWLNFIEDVGQSPLISIRLNDPVRPILIEDERDSSLLGTTLDVSRTMAMARSVKKAEGRLSFVTKLNHKNVAVSIPCEAIDKVFNKSLDIVGELPIDLVFYDPPKAELHGGVKYDGAIPADGKIKKPSLKVVK